MNKKFEEESFPFVKKTYRKPKNHSPDSQPEGKRDSSCSSVAIDSSEDTPEESTQGKTSRFSSSSGTFNLREYKSQEEIKEQIKHCEGKHIQQVAYSSYHDALTQICFTCKKIRTNLKLTGEGLC